MKKKIVIYVIIFVACIMTMLAIDGCRRYVYKEKMEKIEIAQTHAEVEKVCKLKWRRLGEEFGNDSNKNGESVDDIRQLAYSFLGLGFNHHASTLKVSNDGKMAMVWGPERTWKVDAMFANKDFLRTHNVEYALEGGEELEPYTPPTFESQEDFEGDAYGYVLKENLETNQAYRFDGTLWIRVDGYTIICNPAIDYFNIDKGDGNIAVNDAGVNTVLF